MEEQQQRVSQTRSSSFSPTMSEYVDWDDLFSRMDKHQGSVDDFKKLMYQVQERRREFVRTFLHEYNASIYQYADGISLSGTIVECIQLLQKAHSVLSNSENYRKSMLSNSEQLRVNVKDEILGIQKDLVFLAKLHTLLVDGTKIDNFNSKNVNSKKLLELDFIDVLAPYHPVGAYKFVEEHEQCVIFLKRLMHNPDATVRKRKPIMITDWDGTMKDYCSQYVTNLQPIYSALSMAIFSKACTRLTAVLTAGPLRGPGILDLTSLPSDGPVIFGGSWGREWWLDGKRIVHDEGIPDAGLDALERLSNEMSCLLKSQEFSHFGLIGSGVQRKVDRLTLGVQTVCKHVNADLSTKYQEEVRERLHRVDPNEEVLHFDPSTELEVEVVVHSDGVIWNKANGIARLIDTLGEKLDTDKILICGDTYSDLPMVMHVTTMNKEGSMAIFVTSKQALREKVLEIVGDFNRCCFVSSPDVIHAAMMTMLLTIE